MKYADLHTHTTASDGTFSPAGLVALAAEKGLSVLAVTDHDTVSGYIEAAAEGARLGIEVIPGIEISTDYEGQDVHVLGLFLNPDSPSLKPVLDWSVFEKNRRNEKIADALYRDGYGISLDELKSRYPNTVIGRPHIAAALMMGGYVASVSEAFDRFLKKGRPYYRERARIPFKEAVAFILGAEGLAALAHPLQYGFGDEGVRRLAKEAAESGARGIEVFYPAYGSKERAFLSGLARRFSLAQTGGSDFHGANKPEVNLGEAGLSRELFEALKAGR